MGIPKVSINFVKLFFEVLKIIISATTMSAAFRRQPMSLAEYLRIKRTDPSARICLLGHVPRPRTAEQEQWYLPNPRTFHILNLPEIARRSDAQSANAGAKRKMRTAEGSAAELDAVMCPREFYAKHLLVQPLTGTMPSISAAPPDTAVKSDPVSALAESCGVATADSATRAVALVVPFSQLRRVRELFPGVNIRHFESSRMWWTDEVSSGIITPLPGRPLYNTLCTLQAVSREGRGRSCLLQASYTHIVDATQDTELWGSPYGSLFDATLPMVSNVAVDVIVHAGSGTAAEKISSMLAAGMWTGRQLAADARGATGRSDWVHTGVRAMSPAHHTTTLDIVFAAGSRFHSFCQENGEPMRLPTEAARYSQQDFASATDETADDVQQALLQIIEARTDWLLLPDVPAAASATAKYVMPRDVGPGAAGSESALAAPAFRLWDLEILEPTIPGEWGTVLPRVEGEGCVLPVSATVVLGYLCSGDVGSGRVALVDARDNDVCSLRLPAGRKHLATDNREETFAALRTATADAEIVIFYCNHGSSRSPARAKAYLSWLAASLVDATELPMAVGSHLHDEATTQLGGTMKGAVSDAHSSSSSASQSLRRRPCIRMLDGGAGRLVAHAKHTFSDADGLKRLDELFEYYDRSY